jgi:hypothetical protein
MQAEHVRVGIQVRVLLDYRDTYNREAAHRQGQLGTVKKRYGTPEYTAFEVSFPDGQSQLFWDHQLEESEKPSSRPGWLRRLFQ